MAFQPPAPYIEITPSTSVPSHQSHPVMYSAWPQKCAVCDLDMFSSMNMTIHMASHRNVGTAPQHTSSAWPQKCPVCGITIFSSMNMMNHMATHRNVGTAPPHNPSAWPQKCAFCDAEMYSSMNVKIHMASHRNVGNAPQQHTSVPDQGDLPSDPQSPLPKSEEEKEKEGVTCSSSKPQNTSNYICLCFICGMKFTTYVEREQHRCTDRLECNVCGDSFVMPDTFRTHTLSHKQNIKQETKGQEYLQQKKLDCVHCKKVFPYIDLQYHSCIARHYCNYCGTELINLESLKVHQRRHIIKPTPFERLDTLQPLRKIPVRKRPAIHAQKTCNSTNDKGYQLNKCCKCGQVFYKTEHFRAHAILLHKRSKADTFHLTGKLCFVCGRVFRSKRELKEHQFSEYKCLVCKKTFKNEDEAREHRKSHKKKPDKFTFKCTGTPYTCLSTKHTCKPYKCVHCDETFDSHAEVENHKCAPITCSKCDKIYASKRGLNRHVCKTWPCTSCQESFFTKVLMIAHCCPNRPCPDCGKTSTTKEEAENHVCLLYACEVCKKKFHSHLGLKDHCCLADKCSDCGKKLPKKRSVLKKEFCMCSFKPQNKEAQKEVASPPFKMVGVKHICSICGRTFRTISTLKKHNSSSYSCTVCDEVFCKIPALEKHVKKHTVEDIQTSKLAKRMAEANETVKNAAKIESRKQKRGSTRIVPKAAKPSILVVPLNKSAARANAPTQLSTQQPTTSLQCDDCGIFFKKKKEMKNHNCVNPVGNDCPLCNQHFPSPILLQQHAIKDHNTSNPFVCRPCGGVYTSNEELTSHKLKCSQSTAHPAVYVVKRKADQTSHKPQGTTSLSQTTPSVVLGPLICSLCDIVFLKQEDLQGHMLSHTKERALTCRVCKITFPKLTPLKSRVQHIKKCKSKFALNLDHVPPPVTSQQNDSQGKTGSSPVIPNEELANHNLKCGNSSVHPAVSALTRKADQTSHKPQGTTSMSQKTPSLVLGSLICSVCDAVFLKPEDLQGHMLNHHTQERALTCPVCKIKFPTLTPVKYCLQHIKTCRSQIGPNVDHVPPSVTSQQKDSQGKTGSSPVNSYEELANYKLKCGNSTALPADSVLIRKAGQTSQKPQGTTSLSQTTPSVVLGPLICSLCDIVFLKQEDLQGHMLSHTKERALTCRVCKITFPKLTPLKSRVQHIKKCKSKFALNLDHVPPPVTSQQNDSQGKTGSSPVIPNEELANHNLKCGNSSVHPAVSALTRKADQTSHKPQGTTSMSQKTPSLVLGSLICSVCDAVFLKPEDLQGHMLNHHTQERALTCPVCKIKFPTLTPVKYCLQHIKTCRSQIGPNVDHVPPSVTSQQKDSQGKTGSSPVNSYEELANYKLKCGNSTALPADSVLIRKAGQTSQKPQGATSLSQTTPSVVLGSLICSVCDAVFKKLEDLKGHMLSHTKERAVTCPVCKIGFHKLTPLKSRVQHYMMCRSQIALNLDHVPPPVTSQQNDSQGKTGSPPVTSNEELTAHPAGFLLKQKADQTSHKPHGTTPLSQTKPSVVLISLLCSVCDAVFLKPEDLQGHMLSHASECESTCPVCKLKFHSLTPETTRLKHIRTCPAQISTSVDRVPPPVTRQQEDSQGKTSSSSATQTPTESNTVDIDIDVAAVTPLCVEPLIGTRNSMKANPDEKEMPEKTSCELCIKGFKTKDELQKHLASHKT